MLLKVILDYKQEENIVIKQCLNTNITLDFEANVLV